ncbi:MAG TPA: hypothetical protein VHF25_01890 [Nitriliruptorales bacterium]|nr:hypothetical protein [Nitriliruptorales bacterium]
MRIQPGQLIALGYGKYVRSDEVVAIEPIVEDRGPGRRTDVWVRGVPEPIVASRSDAAIADDLVTPAEEAARMQQLRSMLARVLGALDGVPPMLRRLLADETGVDVAALAAEGRRVLDRAV